jgi:hypothetical protein
VFRLQRQAVVGGHAEVTFRLPEEYRRSQLLALGSGVLYVDDVSYPFGQGYEDERPVRGYAVPQLAEALGLRSVTVRLEVAVNGVFLIVEGVPPSVPQVSRETSRGDLEAMQSRLAELRAHLAVVAARRSKPAEKRTAQNRLRELVVGATAAEPEVASEGDIRNAMENIVQSDSPLDAMRRMDEMRRTLEQSRRAQPAPLPIPPDQVVAAARRAVSQLSRDVQRLDAALDRYDERAAAARSAMEALRARCRQIDALVYAPAGAVQ